MDADRRTIAADILSASREHDSQHTDRLARFRNLEPESAELLGLLVRATGAKRILELGTSNGHSTIWLADAAQATGGAVVSVDVDGDRTTLARANLERAGLTADTRVGDAGAVLRDSEAAEWDLIFLDAERPAYAGYWPDLSRVLRPGGLLVVDNVLSHADQVASFLELVADEPRVTSVQVPIGAGLQLIVRNA